MEKLRYKFSDRLTPKEIGTIVDNFKQSVLPEIQLREDYARGNNPSILNRKLPTSAPNNQVPIPYGRRILSIITSYMFLPGSIAYGGENQKLLDALKPIFDYNEEPLESYRIGWQTSLHGVGYEMFYAEGINPEPTEIDNQPGYTGTMPRFEKVPVSETIPIYDFNIVPQLQAFIRFYTIESEDTEYIQVYYPDVMVEYQRKKNGTIMAQTGGEQKHGFDRPPLVPYENNEDMMGDFSAVQPLIDAYDVLMSDSMNEFDRFAQAYLVAKGFTITTDDVEKLKHKRAFSLMNKDDSIAFLTKEIEVEFIKYMSEQLRGEIHRGTGIPNLDDYKWGGGASGETIDKFIYLMELFTGIKEAYFVRGLKQRIDMIAGYTALPGEVDDVEIVMTRNDPDKSVLQADLFTKYSGHISEKTLIENFADFVKDAEEELERLKEEKDRAVEEFYKNQPAGGEDEEAPGQEDEKKPEAVGATAKEKE